MDADRAHEIGLEADYWRLLLEDVLAVNGAIPAAVERLTEIPLEVLGVVMLHADRQTTAALDRITAHARAATRELAAMQERVHNVVNLVQGRATALEAEIRGDT